MASSASATEVVMYSNCTRYYARETSPKNFRSSYALKKKKKKMKNNGIWWKMLEDDLCRFSTKIWKLEKHNFLLVCPGIDSFLKDIYENLLCFLDKIRSCGDFLGGLKIADQLVVKSFCIKFLLFFAIFCYFAEENIQNFKNFKTEINFK